MHLKALSFVLFLLVISSVTCLNTSFVKSIAPYKQCLYKKEPLLCIKEIAFRTLNETIMDDRPIVIGYLEIQKNPDYFVNNSAEENLSEEVSERSSKLSDALLDKLMEYFKSRTVKMNLSNAFEARKGGGGGGGGKKGNGMAMAAAGMGMMMMNMIMGKLALMAGSAMMMAKMSLLICMVMLVKKMQGGGGGGEEKHIVYADSGHSHGGGGGYGGGWHRSLEDPHSIVYRGQWGPSSSENGSGL